MTRLLLVVFAVFVAVRVSAAADYSRVPTGNARDSAETSRTIDEILARCAQRYADCETMVATGRYIEAAKHGTSETQHTAHMRMMFQSPDHLRIDVEGEDMSSLFLADGTTVTFAWPDQKRFAQIPQPDSLGAFSDEERNGEVLRDETGATMQSIAAPLLTTTDTVAWIHANVDEYFYDGVEDTGTTSLVRIRFLQVNPESVVQLWIDPATAWIHKVAIIQARDDYGGLVHSYSEASYAQMNLSIIDEFSTDPAGVKEDSFHFRIPSSWTPYNRFEADDDAYSESLWSGLFRVAAGQQARPTSVTLEAAEDESAGVVELGWFLPFKHEVFAMTPVPATSQTSPCLAVSNSRNRVGLCDAAGKITSQFTPLARPLALAAFRNGDVPLVASGDVEGTISVHCLDGALAWQYQRRAALEGVRAVQTSGGDRLYAAYSDNGALMTFLPSGQLVAATRKAGDVYSLYAGKVAPERVAVLGEVAMADLGVFTEDGRFASEMEFEDMVLDLEFDDQHPSAPLILLGSTELEDVFLRRIALDGAQQWSRSVVQFAEDEEVIYPAGMKILRAHQGRRLVVVLGDGRLFLSDMEGQPVWRGRVRPPENYVLMDETAFVTKVVAHDLNSDGLDEIYLGSEIGVIQVILQ